MTTNTILVCLIFIGFNLSAQNNVNGIYSLQSHQWNKPQQEQSITSKDFMESLQQQFQIPAANELKLISDVKGVSDLRHLKLQQTFNGIEVLGSELFLHLKNQNVVSSNGNVLFNLNLPVIPTINAEEAIDIAIKQFPAQLYAWQKDISQTPQADLVIMDVKYPEVSGEMKLAYRLDIYSYLPLSKKRVYIDAIDGSIILAHETLTTCFSGVGTAQTLYHGTREIETHNPTGPYELLDLTRGDGIETISASGRKYTDDDNTWEAGSWAQRKGALDLHFGAQMTYDYYKQFLKRSGVDNKGSKLLNKLIDTVFYVNAFWDGTTTNFGIGDSVVTNPLTCLDVVAHEITHGLTQHTCGLEYLYESGALNESLSDIFGKAVEKEYDSTRFSWLLGSRFFHKADTAFRSMSDPVRFGNPKNYKGNRWITSATDNGGVHTNSGVLNHWFYLLSEGGAGTTEKNVNYNVTKIGIHKVIEILYEAMTNYLGKTSKYYDMRQATLEIAEQLYGRCSPEYANIIEAWVAVGMGARISENDIMIVNEKIPQVTCKEGYFITEVRLLNLSCIKTLPAGTEITMCISVPRRNKITELFTLPGNLLPGQSVIYKFNNKPFIDRTNTTIQIEAILENDADTVNNRLPLLLSKNSNAEHDFRVTGVQTSGSLCEGQTVQAQVTSNYLGCHPVAVGTPVRVVLEYSSKQVEHTFFVERTVYPNSNYRTPQFSINRDFLGATRVLARLEYANDTLPSNNTGNFFVVYVDNAKLGYLEPFTDQKFDSTLLVVRADSFQLLEINSNIASTEALLISGGKVINDQNRLIPSVSGNLGNMFTANPKFTTNLYACVNTNNLKDAFLSFDYIQKIGNNPWYDSLLVDTTRAALTRVIFRDQQGNSIGTPIYIQKASRVVVNEHFEQSIPITGGPVTIEIQNLVLEGSIDSLTQKIDQSKDYILLDNLRIHGTTVGSDNPVKELDWQVYPIPAFDQINIKMNRDGLDVAKLQIKTTDGKTQFVLKGSLELNPISVGTLKPGLYIIELIGTDGKTSAKKFVKL